MPQAHNGGGMQRVLVIVAASVLVLHGLIHLMGTAAYLKVASVAGIPYKTTVLNGQWDVGANGIRVFGLFWALAAIGFVAGAVGLMARLPWWRSVLLPVTELSLVLTALDWNVAFAGVGVNLVILALLLIGSLR
jgi:hypothetical protein